MSVDFIDSNVFVYLFDDQDERKREIATSIVQEALANGSGVVSFQVVQETINVLTRKLRASTSDVRRFLDAVLVPLWDGLPTPELYQAAITIRDRFGFSFYDSLVIAAAHKAGCTRLLSEDLQHGQRLDDLQIVDPFRT